MKLKSQNHLCIKAKLSEVGWSSPGVAPGDLDKFLQLAPGRGRVKTEGKVFKLFPEFDTGVLFHMYNTLNRVTRIRIKSACVQIQLRYLFSHLHQMEIRFQSLRFKF